MIPCRYSSEELTKNNTPIASRQLVSSDGRLKCNRSAPAFRKTAPNEPTNEAASTITIELTGVVNRDYLFPAPQRR